eukprot:scaffold11962_cov59-Attheya_sp.AAC.6
MFCRYTRERRRRLFQERRRSPMRKASMYWYLAPLPALFLLLTVWQQLSMDHHDVLPHSVLSLSSTTSEHQLPSLRQGGIVVFFHNPKAGGTSLREMAKQNSQMFDHVTSEFTDMEGVEQYMLQWTSQKVDKKVKFLEIHGHPPGFLQLRTRLTAWRTQAETNNIPIFVFTIMREPISWLLSCFNFFCLQIAKYTKCKAPATIEGMLSEARSDPQSRWYCFMHTIMALPDQGNDNMDDCPLDLQEQLVQYMDWVGFTEQYEDTMTVLKGILPPGATKTFAVKNKTNKQFQKIDSSTLNETVTKRLQELMSRDYKLYDGLRQTFQLEKFKFAIDD